MKLLFTIKEFNERKHQTKWPLQCYQCGNTFECIRNQIQFELNHKRNRLKYCSNKCVGISNRSKTKHTIITCATCQKQVKKLTKDIKRSKSGNNFCSVSCSNTFNKTKKPKNCLLCNKPRATKAAKYCIDHKGHNPNTERKKQQTLNKTLLEIKERVNYDSQRMHIQVRAHCRAHNKNLQSNSCAKCEYSYHVQLCHIKPVSSFPDAATLGEINDPSNIVTLCPNCHWEYDNGLLKL